MYHIVFSNPATRMFRKLPKDVQQVLIKHAETLENESMKGEQLASAYAKSLAVAVAHHCHSVAFPSLSTGVYGYPVALAAQTALTTVLAFLREHQQPSCVRFVLFDSRTYTAYAATLREIQGIDTIIT